MNNGVPQLLQEPRAAIGTPWTFSGEGVILIGALTSGWELLHRKAELWKSPKDRKGAPQALRQSMQWQRVMETGRVELS